MSGEESIGKTDRMRAELNAVQEQLQLALQWIQRLELVVNVLSGGKHLRAIAKPGEESHIHDLNVPDDAPLIRLRRVKIPKPSGILSANGTAHAH